MRSGLFWIVGLALIAGSGVATAQTERTFGGHECTVDCTGHAAGYEWAEVNGVTNALQCPRLRNRNSFYEGCLVYLDDPSRGAEEDDDGNPVGALEDQDDEDDAD